MSSVRTKLDSYKLLPKWIRYLSSYLNLFLCSVLLKPKIYGRKNIPQNGPYIVAINHFHIFDPALVAYAIRKPISFLAASDQDILNFISNLNAKSLIDQASLAAMKVESESNQSNNKKGFIINCKLKI